MTPTAHGRAQSTRATLGRPGWWLAGAAVVVLIVVLALSARSALAAGTPYVDGISDQNMAYWNGENWHGGPPISPFGQYVQANLVDTSAAPLRFARYVVAYDLMCDPDGP